VRIQKGREDRSLQQRKKKKRKERRRKKKKKKKNRPNFTQAFSPKWKEKNWKIHRKAQTVYPRRCPTIAISPSGLTTMVNIAERH